MKPNDVSPMSSTLLSVYSLFFVGTAFLHFHLYDNGGKIKNWFRIDVFFLLGFGVVHFQWPIMYGISNIVPEFESRIWVNHLYVNYATWLSTIGGVSWILGFSLLKSKNFVNKSRYTFKYDKLLNLTVLLFILFLLTAGKSFLSGGVYKGEAGGSAGDGIAAYIQLLFSISIILLTTIIILNNRRKYNNRIFNWFLNFDKKFLLLYFSYIILFFSIGDRGGPIFLLLTTTILVGSIIKPFKLHTLIIGVFVGGLFLSIISLGRSDSSGAGIIGAGLQNFEYSSAYDNTVELANSVRTLYRATSEVPQRHGFFFGKLWISNILAPIPFSQTLYLSLTNDVKHELSSSGYITYLTFGPNAKSGEGTSLIADIYLNFGFPGVIILMFAMGLFFKKADVSLHSLDSIKWIIIAAILASFSISFGRGSFLVIIRPIIWSLLLMSFLVKTKKVKL